MAVSRSLNSCKAATDALRKSLDGGKPGSFPNRAGPGELDGAPDGSARLAMGPSFELAPLAIAGFCGDTYGVADSAQLHLRFQEQLHDILLLDLIENLNAALERRLKQY